MANMVSTLVSPCQILIATVLCLVAYYGNLHSVLKDNFF
jgi:hypothetical protein